MTSKTSSSGILSSRSEHYSIRNATSAAEIQSLIIRAIDRQTRPAMDDNEIFYATDPTGFFLGGIDGRTISCMSLVKYEEMYAFLGYFVVDEPFRGNGYGQALFKHGVSTLSPTQNFGLDTLADKIQMYEKWGLKKTWTLRTMLFDVAHCTSYLSKFKTPAGVHIQAANRIDLDLLSAYDTAAFGAPHHRFLKALLSSPHSLNFAATSQSGDVIGFVSTRRNILKKEGWNISPLFADDGQIARALLKHVFLEMAKEVHERKVTAMDILVEINPEAILLANELNGIFVVDAHRMFLRGPPDIPKEKIFSVASTEIG